MRHTLQSVARVPSLPFRVGQAWLLAAALCVESLAAAQGRPPPPPPPPPVAEASLEVRVFPETPVLERSGGLQHLNFEFRLEAVAGPVKLLNLLVRTFDKQGGLSRFRQLVPGNYQDNFSDVAVFEDQKFLGSEPFSVDGPISKGGRVLFFNPWHSFAADEPLARLEYTFYVVDDRGRVTTTTVEVRPVEAKAVLPLRLPFAGRWLVVEGHDYETHHRRIFSPMNAQRYASDFVIPQPDGALYKGDGTRVTDYASFGAEVLSPGPGTVVARENGLPDNPVGARDDQQPLGNHVVIDHGGGVFSVLAHLQQGSITVAAGQKVTAGQGVGRVGNSGASDLPNLHFHLQRGADPAVSRAEGVVAMFSRYRRVVGKVEIPVDSGSPATGEWVAPEPAAAAPAPAKTGTSGRGGK